MVGEIKDDFISAGKIRIALYVPARLLKRSPDEMFLDEFIETLALANYIQELRAEEIAIGIGKVFGE